MSKAAPVSTILLLFAASVQCQRPFFAGSRPIGYPELANKTTTESGLADKFGEDTTTQRLPIEANGDRDLIDRLSKLPIDQQPFWLINWQAYEKHRETPQTYPQRPSPFAEPSFNSGTQNSNTQNTVGNTQNTFGNTPNTVSTTNSNTGIPQTTQSIQSDDTANRFGNPQDQRIPPINGITRKPTPTVPENYFRPIVTSKPFVSTEKPRPIFTNNNYYYQPAYTNRFDEKENKNAPNLGGITQQNGGLYTSVVENDHNRFVEAERNHGLTTSADKYKEKPICVCK